MYRGELPPTKVSTHSRLKAAGHVSTATVFCHWRFNTQPPEGGWGQFFKRYRLVGCFNTQPPEGGWYCPR